MDQESKAPQRRHRCQVDPSKFLSQEGYQTQTCPECGSICTFRVFITMETSASRQFKWVECDEGTGERIRAEGRDIKI